MRAFGVNTEPNFEEYEEFIESRCFPRSRDKMKLELKRLDIPFYDPILIIEKTEGRMAEDEFWIKIDR
jgi:putative transcriptional regulator